MLASQDRMFEMRIHTWDSFDTDVIRDVLNPLESLPVGRHPRTFHLHVVYIGNLTRGPVPPVSIWNGISVDENVIRFDELFHAQQAQIVHKRELDFSEPDIMYCVRDPVEVGSVAGIPLPPWQASRILPSRVYYDVHDVIIYTKEFWRNIWNWERTDVTRTDVRAWRFISRHLLSARPLFCTRVITLFSQDEIMESHHYNWWTNDEKYNTPNMSIRSEPSLTHPDWLHSREGDESIQKLARNPEEDGVWIQKLARKFTNLQSMMYVIIAL